jgi:hypothetical protein
LSGDGALGDVDSDDVADAAGAAVGEHAAAGARLIKRVGVQRWRGDQEDERGYPGCALEGGESPDITRMHWAILSVASGQWLVSI